MCLYLGGEWLRGNSPGSVLFFGQVIILQLKTSDCGAGFTLFWAKSPKSATILWLNYQSCGSLPWEIMSPQRGWGGRSPSRHVMHPLKIFFNTDPIIIHNYQYFRDIIGIMTSIFLQHTPSKNMFVLPSNSQKKGVKL